MVQACDNRSPRTVRSIVDRAGALVERPALDAMRRRSRSPSRSEAAGQGYAYDPYGRPLIRESAGRGDMDDDTDMDSTDNFRQGLAVSGTIWDPRADIDDDGDVDTTDSTLYLSKDNPPEAGPPQSTSLIRLRRTQAFSDVGNPFMFQGRPHFAVAEGRDETPGPPDGDCSNTL